MTLQDFKQQHGLQSITFYKGQGRMYSKVVSATTKENIDLFCSKDCDLTKPLYVNIGAHDAYWVGNNTKGTVAGTV